MGRFWLIFTSGYVLKDPIKETGVFNIEIKLYEGIIGKLKIDIVS